MCVCVCVCVCVCRIASQAPIFGPFDGPGVSIVFYFRLPEDFNPSKFENQKALQLFKRFIANGREADGTLTRDRCVFVSVRACVCVCVCVCARACVPMS